MRRFVLFVFFSVILNTASFVQAHASSNPSMRQMARDVATHCNLHNSMTADILVNQNNFKINVEDGVIELFGNASSHSEKGKVIDYAAKQKFAK